MMINFSPVILHVDMDAFFAAIEIRDNPRLKGKPVIIGGDGLRGVVSTCSYEARRYGVRSGMSSVQARRLCPEGVFVSAALREYVYTSACLQEIFERYTPMVEPFSIDEAFLDITGTERLYGGPEELAQAMKQEIKDRLRLTCSMGIAPSKYLAKLASGVQKPDGMTVMDRSVFRGIFFPRPVDALWGVGESTKRALNAKGIYTVGDLAKAEPDWVKKIFGKNGETLTVMARGTDDGEVLRYRDMPHDKSMSHETTLSVDIQDPSLIKATILWLSDKVARRLRKGGYVGRTISVKVRSSDFSTITRSHTILRPTDRSDIIFHLALKMVPREYGMKYKVRLLGVRASRLERRSKLCTDEKGANCLQTVPSQLDLIVDEDEKGNRQLTRALDSIRDKYGDRSITLAGMMIR